MKRVASILKKMVIIWVGLSLIPLIYYLHLTSESHSFLVQNLESKGEQFLSFVDERAAKHYAQNRMNFHRLSHSKLLNDYAATQSEQLEAYLTDQWVTTAENAKFFSQFRYLDTQGNEVLRVDFNSQTQRARSVPSEELQFKGTRDYFLYAKTLASVETGYFGLDLEYEHGRPLIPYKPAFRIIYPIEVDGIRAGYFIANLEVMSIVSATTANAQNYPVDFIDSNGDYVISSDESKLFSRIIEERSHFNMHKTHPTLWKEIQSSPLETGSLLNNSGLHVFRPFHTRLFETVGGLTLVTTISPQQIAQAYSERDKFIQSDSIILIFLLGIVSGLIALFWDALERSKLEQTFSKVVMDNAVAVAMTDENHNILRVNSRLCQMLGRESGQIKGRCVSEFQVSIAKYKAMTRTLGAQGEWAGQLLIKSDDCQLVCKVEVHAITRGLRKMNYFVYSFTDISEQHRTMMSFKEKSERDPSTALWNKKKFNQTLVHYARLQARYKSQPISTLAIIDIDSFKYINDKLGHNEGDKVILQLATQLLSTLRDTDFIARIGGDEFAVILQHADKEIAFNMMERICHAVNAWRDYQVTVSIGVAEITSNHNQTFINADKALYRSKRKGKNCVTAHGYEQFHVVPKDA